MMGYRMGGDIMMACNFSMFAVITVCIALLILVHTVITANIEKFQAIMMSPPMR